jgi:hypothetical protein
VVDIVSNGDGGVTWQWIVGVSGTIIVLGLSAFLTFTAQRFNTIETTLMDVRLELRGMRSDLRDVNRLDVLVDELRKRIVMLERKQ